MIHELSTVYLVCEENDGTRSDWRIERRWLDAGDRVCHELRSVTQEEWDAELAAEPEKYAEWEAKRISAGEPYRVLGDLVLRPWPPAVIVEVGLLFGRTDARA